MSIGHGQDRDSVSWALGYEVGQSIAGRVLVAALVAIATLAVAYLFWRHQDLAALLATAWVCMWGLRKSWALLPLSSERRAHWASERELYKAHPAYEHCYLFWVGIVLIALNLWHRGLQEVLNLDAMTVPGTFMFIGAACFVLCRRSVANARNGAT